MRSALPPVPVAVSSGIPFIVWAVVWSTALVFVGTVTLFEYRVSGWAWVIPLGISALILVARVKMVAFPAVIWVPWVLFLGVRFVQTDFPALQRTLQIITPLFVAAAVSTQRTDARTLERIWGLLRWLAVFIGVALLYRAGVFSTFTLPQTTGFAAESMTATLLAVGFGVEYLRGNAPALSWWLGMVGVTIFSLTRTELAAAVLSLPLCLVRIGFGRRLAIAVLVGLLGLGIFGTSRMQRKMFGSTTGKIEDVFGDSFRDSGRFFMWQQFRERVAAARWFGYGTGAGERFARSITGGQLQYPHNDWLLTAFDYGYAGVLLYAATMVAATVHAARAAAARTGAAQSFLLTGASAFLPFTVLMYGDNAMAYVSYFGNFQFLMLGLGYAAVPSPPPVTAPPAAVRATPRLRRGVTAGAAGESSSGHGDSEPPA